MSFLGSFFKWARPVGDLVAAPFTGGATLADLPGAVGGLGGNDGGGDNSDVWDADGNFIGDSTIMSYDPNGSSSSGSNPWMAGLQKYAAPVAGGALSSLLANRNAGKQREQQQAGMALTQSQLDPFRGVMNQTRDMSRLDMAANGDYSPTPIQLDSKYGAGLDAGAMVKTPYTPSAQTKDLMHSAMGMVASGSGAAPNYADPKNMAKPLPFASALPQASAAGPTGAPLSPDEQRRLALMAGGSSPWLQEAV